MTNLATYLWTTGDDVVIGFSSAYLAAGQSASTGNGDDVVIGIGIVPGLTFNEDQFVAGVYVGPSGLYLGEGSVLNTGNGADMVAGTGANGIDDPVVFGLGLPGGNGGDGIRNRGSILTGNGSDLAVGLNGQLGPIIRGQGGDGADATSSSSLFNANDGRNGGNGGAGIRNLNTGSIRTGNGSDLLVGLGGEGGDGGNGWYGVGGSNRNGGNGGDGGDGLRNEGGRIETGNGDDVIIGIGGAAGAAGAAGNAGSAGTPGRQGFGVYNSGIIDMGRGDDVLDAGSGGFGGNGTVKMGFGDDVVKGFGSGTFVADKGFDRLLLNSGTYNVVTGSASGSFNISNGAMPGVTMVVSGFESLNGQAFGTGTFVVA